MANGTSTYEIYALLQCLVTVCIFNQKILKFIKYEFKKIFESEYALN